ncbi:hypothetical protein FOQG_16492, partial [Fusarium oxysporum f. sp. raphani 54005]
MSTGAIDAAHRQGKSDDWPRMHLAVETACKTPCDFDR